MPSPVLPDEFCDAVPTNNANFCTRFTKFLNVPQLLCDFFGWFLTDGGSVSDEAKAEIATYSTPTGMFAYFASQNVGTGWLLCDGSAVSRTTYAALYAEVGTRYGAGDGSSTFNLPDGRGRSLLGAGTGSGLTYRDVATKYVGEESHTQTVAELPAHSHEVTTYRSASTAGDGGAILNQPDPGLEEQYDTSETGGGSPFNVIHPCVIAYLYVKT